MTNVHIVIDIGSIPATEVCLERFKLMPPLIHFADRIRREEVVVDAVELFLWVTLITLRPLLGITDGTDTTQVGAWHEVGLVVILYNIGEGEV